MDCISLLKSEAENETNFGGEVRVDLEKCRSQMLKSYKWFLIPRSVKLNAREAF